MAMLKFNLEGQELLSRNFRILADGITKMRPEFWQIGESIITGVNKNFSSTGTELQKWAPLAASTKQARANRTWHYKKAPNKPSLLRWTGKLQDGFYKEVWDLQVVVTNDVPYFKHHQTRFRSGKKLPRRVMLDMSQQVKLEVTNIIAKGINKRIGNFWKQF